MLHKNEQDRSFFFVVVVAVAAVAVAVSEAKTVKVKAGCAASYTALAQTPIVTKVMADKYFYEQIISYSSGVAVEATRLVRCDYKDENGRCLYLSKVLWAGPYQEESCEKGYASFPNRLEDHQFEYTSSESVDCPHKSQTKCVEYCNSEQCETVDSESHMVRLRYQNTVDMSYVWGDATLADFENICPNKVTLKSPEEVNCKDWNGSSVISASLLTLILSLFIALL